MFNISICIYNFFKDKEFFKNIFWFDRKITKNKCFEFECIISNDKLFEFNLDLRCAGYHHAGPSLIIGIFGYTLAFRFYDTRHWDYELNDWKYIDRFHDC